MGAEEQLESRRAALRAQLTRLGKSVSTLDDPTPECRVQAALTSEIAALEAKCGGPPSWQANADLARSLRSLAERFLELSAGMSARAEGLDEGWCRVADALLLEVSRMGGPAWVLATVPADADYFSERDHVIRIRWLGEGIWTLPLALHELGHFVGRRLEESAQLDDERWEVFRPLEVRLRETGEEIPADWHHLHELFADAYATYVGGPAYLGCCVTAGLDPVDDAQDMKTHPTPSRRVALVLDVLTRMNACADNSANLHFDVEPWRTSWLEAVTAVGSPADLMLSGSDQELAEFIWTILRDRLPASRYRTLKEAKMLSGKLLNGDKSPAVGPTRMTDALKAVWSARHQPQAKLIDIEERARALFDRMATP
jgi:hypothetical protein